MLHQWFGVMRIVYSWRVLVVFIDPEKSLSISTSLRQVTLVCKRFMGLQNFIAIDKWYTDEFLCFYSYIAWPRKFWLSHLIKLFRVELLVLDGSMVILWGMGKTIRYLTSKHNMMTSSNGNIFRVTGPLCGAFTVDRWIPLTKASDTGFDVLFDLRLNKRLSK